MDSIEDIDTFDSSDDSSDEEELTCSRCEGNFRSSDRGCSVWRSLCEQCHDNLKAAIARLRESKRSKSEQDAESASESDKDNEDNNDNNVTNGDNDDNNVTIGDNDDNVTNGDNDDNVTNGDNDDNIPPSPAVAVVANSEWSAEVWRAFNSNEVSIDLNIYGIPECYVRKKYRNDPDSSPVHIYIDLELTDKAPLLFDYVYISAHFNKSKKTLVLSRSIVTHKQSGAKYIVLTLLRSKCPSGKYSAVLMDAVTFETFRISLTALRNDYIIATDGEIDKKGAEDKLIEWVEQKGLVWDRTRPNKTIEGRPDHESWAPGRPVRQRTAAVTYTDAPPPPKPPPKPKGTANKKRGARGGNKRKTVEATQCVEDLTDETSSGDIESENDSHALALRIAQLESQVKAKNVMLGKKRKLEHQLQLLNSEEDDLQVAALSVTAKPTNPVTNQKRHADVSIQCSPTKAEAFVEVNHSKHSSAMAMSMVQPLEPKASLPAQGMSLMEMQVLQNQTIRIHESYNAQRNLALQNALYENMILSRGGFK